MGKLHPNIQVKNVLSNADRLLNSLNAIFRALFKRG